MFVGFTLLRLGGVTYYSATFPRLGLAALFAWDVLALSCTDVTVAIESKDYADTSWTATTATPCSTPGLYTIDMPSLKEEVRITYVVHGSNDYDSAYLNMLAPAWRPY